MKIALIGDVEDGTKTLSEVVTSLNKHQAEEIWCVDDIIDFGTFPDGIKNLGIKGKSVLISQVDLNGQEQLQKSLSTTVETHEIMRATLSLAESNGYDPLHSHQVAGLALKLFRELKPIHKLDDYAEFLLHISSILHDIGWIRGQKNHHKTAMSIILNTKLLPLDDYTKLIISCVVRYHRKAEPSKKHKHYSKLKPQDQTMVKKLSALLRVADGLDHSHSSLVKDIECLISDNTIKIKALVTQKSEIDQKYGIKKGKLLKKIAKRDLIIEFQTDSYYSFDWYSE